MEGSESSTNGSLRVGTGPAAEGGGRGAAAPSATNGGVGMRAGPEEPLVPLASTGSGVTAAALHRSSLGGEKVELHRLDLPTVLQILKEIQVELPGWSPQLEPVLTD